MQSPEGTGSDPVTISYRRTGLRVPGKWSMGPLFKKCLAEFIATFFWVFAGVGSIVASAQLGGSGILAIAVATGLAVAVAVGVLGKFSGGHANPAISIAFFLNKRLSATELFVYVTSQLAGAAVAALALKAFFVPDAVNAVTLGLPTLNTGVTQLPALVIELILTFFLGFVFWGFAVDPKGSSSVAPFAIGLTVTLDILVGGAFTGAAVNPARWFGPAVVTGKWSNAIVWTLGPILGALVASVIYETVFLAGRITEASDEIEPGAAG
jgi:MIP family channel proteins